MFTLFETSYVLLQARYFVAFHRPANVMLVIASGLNYAFPNTVNLIAMFVAVLVIVAAFILVCIYTSQEFQLKIAKILTLSFSIVMTITTVGLMAQVCT